MNRPTAELLPRAMALHEAWAMVTSVRPTVPQVTVFSAEETFSVAGESWRSIAERFRTSLLPYGAVTETGRLLGVALHGLELDDAGTVWPVSFVVWVDPDAVPVLLGGRPGDPTPPVGLSGIVDRVTEHRDAADLVLRVCGAVLQ